MLTMLTAYCDAAGDNRSVGAISVGGFVSDVRAWSRFEKRWRQELDRFEISEFHMTDFVCGHRPFEKYRNRPDLQAEVLARLCPIIIANTRKSFGFSVVLDDWREVNAVYRLKECRLSPYALGAFAAMNLIVPWAGRSRKNFQYEKIVFEQGDNGQGDFKWLLDELLFAATREQRESLQRIYPLFQPKSLLPLQACDLAMWEKRKATAQLLGQDRSPIRETLLTLLKKPRDWQMLKQPKIIWWAEKFGVPQRTDSWNRRTWRPRFLRWRGRVVDQQ